MATVEKSNNALNRLGLALDDYKGLPSTLCAGCGHDAITNSIVKSLLRTRHRPAIRVAKMSGIGCSSKTPAYFLNQSHGINSLHGRMSTIATGASLANHTMLNIGVSGDGDTASIGLGNFLHMVRRNVPILYIVENNGCYGLTKGQFSATADVGSVKKGGQINRLDAVDICALAIQMGCGFVARSFSGDTQQVKTLIKAALSHKGTAVLDIISPCVTFNNHEGSTKSVTYARKHEEHIQELDFIPEFDQIMVDYEPGEMQTVTMHDGSTVTLKKLDVDHDPTSRASARKLLDAVREDGTFYTGLIYYNEYRTTVQDNFNLVDEPLATLPDERIKPGREAFDELMAAFR
jgi:2-oxoglutarate/2-oxoacid ferredoxin oxidoreductase subunit beta